MSAKLIRFNLPITIASSQLIWSKHAKQRAKERGVVLPRGITSWDMVEYRWNDSYELPALLLTHKRTGVTISVTKEGMNYYKVITCYWENAA